jgi:hypothetical protein
MQRLNNSQQGRKIILESARRELVDELNAETPHRLSEIPVEEAKAAMLEAEDVPVAKLPGRADYAGVLITATR